MPTGRDDEEWLTADIIELARQYGRYGYRKIAALLRHAGWLVNDKRVERIWRTLSYGDSRGSCCRGVEIYDEKRGYLYSSERTMSHDALRAKQFYTLT